MPTFEKNCFNCVTIWHCITSLSVKLLQVCCKVLTPPSTPIKIMHASCNLTRGIYCRTTLQTLFFIESLRDVERKSLAWIYLNSEVYVVSTVGQISFLIFIIYFFLNLTKQPFSWKTLVIFFNSWSKNLTTSTLGPSELTHQRINESFLFKCRQTYACVLSVL